MRNTHAAPLYSSSTLTFLSGRIGRRLPLGHNANGGARIPVGCQAVQHAQQRGCQRPNLTRWEGRQPCSNVDRDSNDTGDCSHSFALPMITYGNVNLLVVVRAASWQ